LWFIVDVPSEIYCVSLVVIQNDIVDEVWRVECFGFWLSVEYITDHPHNLANLDVTDMFNRIQSCVCLYIPVMIFLICCRNKGEV
jgi:hypothetical protein